MSPLQNHAGGSHIRVILMVNCNFQLGFKHHFVSNGLIEIGPEVNKIQLHYNLMRLILWYMLDNIMEQKTKRFFFFTFPYIWYVCYWVWLSLAQERFSCEISQESSCCRNQLNIQSWRVPERRELGVVCCVAEDLGDFDDSSTLVIFTALLDYTAAHLPAEALSLSTGPVIKLSSPLDKNDEKVGSRSKNTEISL